MAEHNVTHERVAGRGPIVLILSTFILGALAGLGAAALMLILEGIGDGVQWLSNLAVEKGFGTVSLWRLVFVVAAALIAGCVWWKLRTRTKRVPSVAQAVQGAVMPVWQSITHVLLQIFIVGTGSSIGREVAPRELGALLAQRYCALLKLDAATTKMLVAVTAAAGLAGVYDAPLAGTMFAVEILLADIRIRTVGVALGASATAAFVADSLTGRHAYYDVAAWQNALGGQFPVPANVTAFAVICGIVCGFLGAWFRILSSWAGKHKPQGVGIVWAMPLAAMCTGLVAIWMPQVMGNGQKVAQSIFDTSLLPQLGGISVPFVVLILMLAKAVLTIATIRSGASGGVLQPGIAVGACAGALLGLAWMLVFPGTSLSIFVFIGAAALLSASQQAPLMALFLVMELTESPIALAVPAGVAVMMSVMVSGLVLKTYSRS